MSDKKVVLLRGYNANPWDLKPWEQLCDQFDVSYLRPRRNLFDTELLSLQELPSLTVRDLLPAGWLGDAAGHLLGDRYLRAGRHFQAADIVHAAELGTWFSAQAAREKTKANFKLVLTVWETIPFIQTYRNRVRTRAYRNLVIESVDFFLPTTERAKQALLLEGVAEDKIEVCPPGIDLEAFATSDSLVADGGRPLVVSVGRLVWEKGHQDLIRAVAVLKKGLIANAVVPKVMIVGEGPERKRLEAYAGELGLEDIVSFSDGMSYDRMPHVFAQASCLVLASLAIPSWEEQFGMVLAEAMAARIPIAAADSGAIPEVLAGYGTHFASGDWIGLAKILADLPSLDRGLAQVDGFSVRNSAEKLRAVYDRLT